MLRKMLVWSLLMLFVLPLAAPVQATELTVLDKTAAIEGVLYGAEQTGSLLERVGKIEKDMYGVQATDALITRVDNVYNYINVPSAATPSFVLKLNAVEWALTHGVTTEPAKARLEKLERMMLGNVASGSMDGRLGKLVKLAFANGNIDVSAVNVGKDTLVKIKIVSPLDTRTNRAGDAVVFQAAEDIFSNGVLIVGKGAVGYGKVTKVEPKRNFGRDAKLDISFDNIRGLDGSVIETLMGEKAKEETKSLAKAAGATVAGLVILGPIGVVGGAFVHGQDITIPAGTELYIQTKEAVQIYGITAN